MKRILMVFAATLVICGACVLTSCSNKDNSATMPDEIETEEFAVTTLNVDGLPQEGLYCACIKNGHKRDSSFCVRTFLSRNSLFTKTEGLDDGTITVDVVNVQILQQLAALTDEHGQ